MRQFLYLLLVFSVANGVPEGYFYQQYQSKSSSSSYKNNQLQHKANDESYYSKQGDLTGEVKPKVNAYNQHTEYQNPNAPHTDNLSGLGRLGSLDPIQTHVINPDLDEVGPEDVTGTFSGKRKDITYSGSYRFSGGDSQLFGRQYGGTSLVGLTQQLQSDLSRQLQAAIEKQYKESTHSYGSSLASTVVEADLRALENELKANLTRQLQEALHTQQYTLSDSNTHANYDSQEVINLRAQLQRNLVKELQEGVMNEYNRNSQNSYSSSSSSSSSSQQAASYGGYKSTGHVGYRRPEYPVESPRDTTVYLPSPVVDETPIVNPEIPLIDITSQVQNDIDHEVNIALQRLQHDYSGDIILSYQPDFEVILQDIKNQIQHNVTRSIEAALFRNYGTQQERGSYFYSTGRQTSSGAPIANYKIDDLSNLRKQIERNLFKKVTQVINEQKSIYRNKTYNQRHYSTYDSQHQQVEDIPRTSYTYYRPQVDSHTRENEDDTTFTSHVNVGPVRPHHTPSGSTHATSHQLYDHRQSHVTHAQDNSRIATDDVSGHTHHNPRRPNYPNRDVEPITNYQPSYPIPQSRPTTHEGRYRYLDSGITNYQPSYPIPQSRPTTDEGSTTRNRYPDSSSLTHYPSSSGSYHTDTRTDQSSQHSYAAGSRDTGVEIASGAQVQLQNIRDQLQNDFSRQIQNVIREQHERQSSSSYSSSSSASSSNQILSQLTEDLKSNLTQKLEELLRQNFGRQGMRGGYSYTITGGEQQSIANYHSQQLADLTQQLQEDLLKQLREGLAGQSYHRSWSSHSSSASYRPVVAYGTYPANTQGGQYSSSSGRYKQMGYVHSSGAQMSTDMGECCTQSDDSFTRIIENSEPKRLEQSTKKSFSRGDIQQKQESDEDLTQQIETQQQLDVNFDQDEDDSSFDIESKPAKDIDNSEEAGLEIDSEINVIPYDDNKNKTNKIHDTQQSTNTERNNEEQVRHFAPSQYANENINTLGHHHLTQRRENISQSTQQSETIDRHVIDLTQRSQNLTHMKGVERQTQQIQDLTQQTEDLSQHTEDLSQQTVDLTHQTEDLSQQTVDLTQQSEDLSQHTEDLTQQTEDLSQHTENLTHKREDVIKQTEDLTQHTQNLTQAENLTQKSLNLTRQATDFTQQTQDQAWQTQDLTQQVQDFSQQTQDISHHTDLSQEKPEDLLQQQEDLTQQIEQLSHRDLIQHKVIESQQEDSSQQEDLTRQMETDFGYGDSGYHRRSHFLNSHSSQNFDDTHHHYSNNFNWHDRNNHPRHHYGGHHRSSAYNDYQTDSIHSSSHFGLQHSPAYHATIQQTPDDTTGSLTQQQIDKHVANVVQDVSHQVQTKPTHVSFEQVSDSADIQSTEQHLVEVIETTTAKQEPGFWKKLGNKIKDTYKKAKDTISENLG